MSVDLRSFFPNRISGQIAMIMVASVIVIHFMLAALFFISRPEHPPDRLPEQLVTLVHLIEATPAAARPELMANAASAFPNFDLTMTPSLPGAETKEADDKLVEGVRRHLGRDYQVSRLAPANTPGALPRIAVKMRGGDVLSAQIAAPPASRPPLRSPFMPALLLIAISVTSLSIWATRVLTKPLRNFTKAAEGFRPEGDLTPLPEHGPAEISAAARALNRMHERIKELIDGRTRMLAAVSHDLRTPITRLRLSSEFIVDKTLRSQTLDELDHMNSMVESVLVYLRGGQSHEPATMVDIATSVRTICDQFADMGYDVTYGGPDHLVFRGHPEELRRAVTNLVDNAVRHGNKIDVHLSGGEPTVSIEVRDDGPGIPNIEKQAMQQPFVRGNSARGMNDNNGFGLGLSITRAAVEAHGGTLDLIDRSPSGLIARIALPSSGTASN